MKEMGTEEACFSEKETTFFFSEPSSEGMSVFDGGGTAGSPVTGSSSVGSEESF